MKVPRPVLSAPVKMPAWSLRLWHWLCAAKRHSGRFTAQLLNLLWQSRLHQSKPFKPKGLLWGLIENFEHRQGTQAMGTCDASAGDVPKSSFYSSAFVIELGEIHPIPQKSSSSEIEKAESASGECRKPLESFLMVSCSSLVIRLMGKSRGHQRAAGRIRTMVNRGNLITAQAFKCVLYKPVVSGPLP